MSSLASALCGCSGGSSNTSASSGGTTAQATGVSSATGDAASDAGGAATGGAGGTTSTKLLINVLTTGTDFACAALSDGTVHCWGDGFLGQLGNGGQVQHQIG